MNCVQWNVSTKSASVVKSRHLDSAIVLFSTKCCNLQPKTLTKSHICLSLHVNVIPEHQTVLSSVIILKDVDQRNWLLEKLMNFRNEYHESLKTRRPGAAGFLN